MSQVWMSWAFVCGKKNNIYTLTHFGWSKISLSSWLYMLNLCSVVKPGDLFLCEIDLCNARIIKWPPLGLWPDPFSNTFFQYVKMTIDFFEKNRNLNTVLPLRPTEMYNYIYSIINKVSFFHKPRWCTVQWSGNVILSSSCVT